VKPTVYIETTVPSYYADNRPLLARDIERTREWWDRERGAYECFISPVVLDELGEGDYPTRSACQKLVDAIPMLAIAPRIVEIAEIYQTRKVMPKPPVRDALHVAFASYYRMDYLLTWNCRHLANANKMRHLETINLAIGLALPLIVTPLMLLPLEDVP
jgi:predicted nucleic acid-binding protein